jgi:hypothetical protein
LPLSRKKFVSANYIIRTKKLSFRSQTGHFNSQNAYYFHRRENFSCENLAALISICAYTRYTCILGEKIIKVQAFQKVLQCMRQKKIMHLIKIPIRPTQPRLPRAISQSSGAISSSKIQNKHSSDRA